MASAGEAPPSRLVQSIHSALARTAEDAGEKRVLALPRSASPRTLARTLADARGPSDVERVVNAASAVLVHELSEAAAHVDEAVWFWMRVERQNLRAAAHWVQSTCGA